MAEPKATHVVREIETGVPEFPHITDVTTYRDQPLLTSRIEVDMDTGLARCTVRLRNGYTATLIMSQSERYRHTPPELKARIALVRAALISWGVGDERWHDRDVGRAADLLLALHLPQAAEPFRQALLVPDADRIAGYLTAGP